MTSARVRDRAAEFVSLVRILARHDDGRAVAKCRGYKVIRTALGRYRCDCPAGFYGQECSHAEALRMALEQPGCQAG